MIPGVAEAGLAMDGIITGPVYGFDRRRHPPPCG
jgi:hypothetical protein